jgi:hypothetical protein
MKGAFGSETAEEPLSSTGTERFFNCGVTAFDISTPPIIASCLTINLKK